MNAVDTHTRRRESRGRRIVQISVYRRNEPSSSRPGRRAMSMCMHPSPPRACQYSQQDNSQDRSKAAATCWSCCSSPSRASASSTAPQTPARAVLPIAYLARVGSCCFRQWQRRWQRSQSQCSQCALLRPLHPSPSARMSLQRVPRRLVMQQGLWCWVRQAG